MWRIGLGIHADGAITMTTGSRAIVDNTSVIVNRAQEGRGGMANAAIFVCRHMCR